MKRRVGFSNLDGLFPNSDLFWYFTHVVLPLYITVMLLGTLGTLSYTEF